MANTSDPLHGKTLESLVIDLYQLLGWQGLAEKIPVRCFQFDPSIKSALKFLRKTPWARERVEQLWLVKIGWQEED